MKLKTAEAMSVFLAGSILYGICEILWRGYTHWTMPVLGGICFLGLYYGEKKFRQLSIILRCFSGGIFISSLELVTGSIVNTALGMNVWDYSDNMFNLFGQVCPKFTFMWMLLCLPAFVVCRFMEGAFKQKTVQ